MPSESRSVAMRSFIDTNILVYADDAFDKAKQQVAIDLVVALRAGGEGVLSIQVLQEYYINAVRKLNLDPAFARRRVQQFGRFELVRPDLELVLAAIDLQQLHRLSFWDALIVQAASVSGCAQLYSEDLQHQRVLAGVRIVNPFI